MSGKDIFLSYAREDRDRIRPLARALEGTGWTLFWDETGIPTGSDWREVLDKEASSSRSMVVVWSKVSVTRAFVREEAEEARVRGVLVPVRIDAVPPPLGFRSTHYLDLVGWDGTASAPSFQRFVSDLSTLLGRQPLVPEGQLNLAAGSTGSSRDKRAREEYRRVQAGKLQDLGREARSAGELSVFALMAGIASIALVASTAVWQQLRPVSEAHLRAGAASTLVAALLFYLQRSHVDWLRGQIESAPSEAAGRYWRKRAVGWETWVRYRAGWYALGVSVACHVAAFTEVLRWLPSLSPWLSLGVPLSFVVLWTVLQWYVRTRFSDDAAPFVEWLKSLSRGGTEDRQEPPS